MKVRRKVPFALYVVQVTPPKVAYGRVLAGLVSPGGGMPSATDPKAVRLAAVVGGHRCPRTSTSVLRVAEGRESLGPVYETGLGRPAGRGLWLSSVEIARFSDALGSGCGHGRSAPHRGILVDLKA